MELNSDEYVDITEDKEMKVEFLYSVKWKKTDIPFDKRMEKYSNFNYYREIQCSQL